MITIKKIFRQGANGNIAEPEKELPPNKFGAHSDNENYYFAESEDDPEYKNTVPVFVPEKEQPYKNPLVEALENASQTDKLKIKELLGL